jgi:hypothetical protein
MALSLGFQARVALERGDRRTSLTLRLESLAINRELGDRRALALSLEGLADWAAGGGDFVRAARFWGGAHRLREASGVAMPKGMQHRHQVRREAARAAFADPEDFDRAWQIGRVTTLERLIDDGLASQAPAPSVPS